MPTSNRPLPLINEDSAQYWQSARDHQLQIQRCLACGEPRFYPSLACHTCGHLAAEWFRVTGSGTVYSYTVVRRAGIGNFASRMPYTIALVALDEGPVMMANIMTADLGDVDADDPAAGVSIGAKVRLSYEDVTDDVSLPIFVVEPTS